MNVTAIQLSEEQAKPRTVRRWLVMDPLLMVAALGLVGCSLITLKGAVGTHYAERQALYAGMGLLVALLISRFDYSRLREYRYGFYALMVISNIVVYGMPAQLGARRWIPLPILQVQPSEFGKILMILALAGFFVERSRSLYDRRTTARVMLLSLVGAMIVIGQPDLGTGLVYVVIAVAILFFGGVSWKQLSALAALFVVAGVLVLAVAPALGVNVLKTYQKERLTTFINPPRVCGQNDTTCYQLNQSLIAIGSGQKTGRGVAGATQTKFQFIPEAQEDFIFAVVGETYGFVGAALVLSLYALLIWRTIRILTMAKNLFGTVIAGGILGMIMFQVFVNVGMTLGVMPVTGVPLPLMSYGGSSVLVTFISLGLLQSIYAQGRAAEAGKSRISV
ncbi:MAG TPA: FtsW/RodA/SpoVE family cell cycle protein [Solirubrobacteraceae bacterium]|jgi:rod shape determining protein RodA|nr:FtsW/RodA/SpoVE family cell cycle protein [Solirubrobacteraceae bacterium]